MPARWRGTRKPDILNSTGTSRCVTPLIHLRLGCISLAQEALEMDGPQSPRGQVERGRALIAAAIVAASLVIYWGMPEAPHYQLAASGSAVVRMDTDSGEMIACDMQRCTRIMEPDRAKTIKLFDGGASKS